MIVYSCSALVPFFLGYFSFELAWVLSRERVLSEESMQTISDIFATELPYYNFPADFYHTIQDEAGCTAITGDPEITGKYEPYL